MAALKRILFAAIAILTAAQAPPAAAQSGLQLIEQEIKAGLLYNFLLYTEWPDRDADQPSSANVVCLFGGDPFAGRLAPMSGRTVNQTTIELRTVAGIAELEGCTLIFVAAGEEARWDELRAALAGRSVLTVSDFEGFAESGGMIEFVRVNDRIGIEVNTGAVAAARLEVQDRLLSLASAVHNGVPE